MLQLVQLFLQSKCRCLCNSLEVHASGWYIFLGNVGHHLTSFIVLPINAQFKNYYNWIIRIVNFFATSFKTSLNYAVWAFVCAVSQDWNNIKTQQRDPSYLIMHILCKSLLFLYEYFVLTQIFGFLIYMKIKL